MSEIIRESWQFILVIILIVSIFTFITRLSSEELIKKIQHWKPQSTFFLIIIFLGGPLSWGACVLAVYLKYKKMTPPEKDRFKDTWEPLSTNKGFPPEETSRSHSSLSNTRTGASIQKVLVIVGLIVVSIVLFVVLY